MYKSIVVGTDGSETAGEAVRTATELARLCGAELHLVSAYRVLTDLALAGSAAAAVPVPVWVADEIQAQVSAMLKALSDAIDEEGVRCTTHARPQSAAEAIIQVAESHHADLIIVGSRGMQGARRLLGSVPNAVAHHAPCDVLVVHTC